MYREQGEENIIKCGCYVCDTTISVIEGPQSVPTFQQDVCVIRVTQIVGVNQGFTKGVSIVETYVPPAGGGQ